MQSLTATATSAMAVKACVIILCLFLRCCLQKVTLKQQREIATFCIFEREVNYTRTVFKICFWKFDAVLHILFGISLTV